MKLKIKRLLSVVLSLVMIVAMLPMTAKAENPTTLYLKPTGNWVQNNERYAAYFFNDAGNTWVSCTDANEDRIYECDVPTGYTKVIFCRMSGKSTQNNWSYKWDQTADLAIPSDGNNLYEITSSSNGKAQGKWSVYDPSAVVESTYVVAGVKSLCGTEWNANDTNNQMTKNEDGTYSITYKDVAEGEYQFKVVCDSSIWYGNEGNNIAFEVSATCDVTITFNPETKAITVIGDGVGEAKLIVNSVTAAGVGSGNFLNGVSWDPAAEANHMTNNGGVWSITYDNIAAGTYTFKFAANDAWDYSWGYDKEVKSGVEYEAYLNGGNTTVTVETGGSSVTLILDLSNMDTKGNGAKMKVEVTAPAPSEPDVIKHQVRDNNGINEVRLVTYVDSLDYQKVTFNLTYKGTTKSVDCTTVYEKINAQDEYQNAEDVFGNGAQYFATVVLSGVPAGAEFTVTVTWTDLAGETATCEAETVVVGQE